MAIRVQEAASLRLDEIYRYTRDRWGADQADRYITDLFAALERIEGGGVASRPVPAEFGVDGLVILPVLTGHDRRTQAAIFSFMAGVSPPMPMLGRSLL